MRKRMLVSWVGGVGKGREWSCRTSCRSMPCFFTRFAIKSRLAASSCSRISSGVSFTGGGAPAAAEAAWASALVPALIPVLTCSSALLPLPSLVFASWPDCACVPSGAGVAFADVPAVAAAGAGDAEAITSCDIVSCALLVRGMRYDMVERAQAARGRRANRHPARNTCIDVQSQSEDGAERTE